MKVLNKEDFTEKTVTELKSIGMVQSTTGLFLRYIQDGDEIYLEDRGLGSEYGSVTINEETYTFK